jgi:hypothetical protein
LQECVYVFAGDRAGGDCVAIVSEGIYHVNGLVEEGDTGIGVPAVRFQRRISPLVYDSA